MITSPQEYWSILYRIQDANRPDIIGPGNFPDFQVPAVETIYNIDLHARTIEAPRYLSVQHDHKSEFVYFRCPQFYDAMDLSRLCCIIQYKNANGDERIYPVPFLDLRTEHAEENMLIPWLLDGEVTRYAGTVEFAIRFYEVDADNHAFIYSLNTQPAKSVILHGLDSVSDDHYDYDQATLNEILARLARVEKTYEVYWLEVQHDDEGDQD